MVTPPLEVDLIGHFKEMVSWFATLSRVLGACAPAGPQTIEPDPKYPVEGCEPRPPVLLSLKDGQLVAQGEDLELELGTGPKPVSYDHGQKS